jgi:hypothetical protein
MHPYRSKNRPKKVPLTGISFTHRLTWPPGSKTGLNLTESKQESYMLATLSGLVQNTGLANSRQNQEFTVFLAKSKLSKAG